MHVLDNRLVAPGAKLADGSGHHVEAASAAGDLEQLNCSVEDCCCMSDVALADMGEGEIPRMIALDLCRPWRRRAVPGWLSVASGFAACAGGCARPARPRAGGSRRTPVRDAL
jgi:hypothetical protein